MRAWVGILVAMTALAFPAMAHPESDAPLLRADVVGAGHEPAVVAAHTQWQGFLELSPDSNVTSAFYQVCIVGQACFAPPAPAERDGNSFRFNTSTYLANGKPVDYQPSWHLGVTWLLEERLANGTTQTVRFPVGPDVLSAECQGEAALACAEAHYLTFDIAGKPRESPGLPALGLLVLPLALAAILGRRRRQP